MAHDSNCGDSASTPNAKLSATSGKGEGGTQVDQLLTPASVGQASLSLSLCRMRFNSSFGPPLIMERS